MGPTLEPKFRVTSFAHVKTEFKYRSGIVELGLGGFLRGRQTFFSSTSIFSDPPYRFLLIFRLFFAHNFPELCGRYNDESSVTFKRKCNGTNSLCF